MLELFIMNSAGWMYPFCIHVHVSLCGVLTFSHCLSQFLFRSSIGEAGWSHTQYDNMNYFPPNFEIIQKKYN